MEIRKGIKFKLNRTKDWYNIGFDDSYFKNVFTIKDIDKIKYEAIITWTDHRTKTTCKRTIKLHSVEYNFKNNHWLPQIKYERKEKLKRIKNDV